MSQKSPQAPAHDLSDPPPVRPPEPDAADCCGEGCVRCIYDVHDEKMERYREALERWRARQR
ncbi:MAG: oxidoreductase-like domain-containing protein [Pseudomonadota bacterium]|nr:oxidoreductase-like domain-containing protein [Pseudomonadota bacterium]